ncbi:MAG: DALR domain-containing protein, partial [Burkholderiaceae bacterium]
GEPSWASPWGGGRPGWHIECSAMSTSLLGSYFDLHGGGEDLKFPHHENEIAQTEGAFGGTLATVWMHCGPLMVNDDKMSKSLGNFRTIRETVAAGSDLSDTVAFYRVNPREAEMLRFFIVRNHYRSVQNYALDNLIDAQNALDRLYQTLRNVPPARREIDWDHPAAHAFRVAMDDDFNTSGAITVLFELSSEANRSGSDQVSGLLQALGGVLGLLQHDPADYLHSPSRYQSDGDAGGQLAVGQIEALIAARVVAKKERNFVEADRLRTELHKGGIELEDKPGGITHWRRV